MPETQSINIETNGREREPLRKNRIVEKRKGRHSPEIGLPAGNHQTNRPALGVT